jgi:hypothetical protein
VSPLHLPGPSPVCPKLPHPVAQFSRNRRPVERAIPARLSLNHRPQRTDLPTRGGVAATPPDPSRVPRRQSHPTRRRTSRADGIRGLLAWWRNGRDGLGTISSRDKLEPVYPRFSSGVSLEPRGQVGWGITRSGGECGRVRLTWPVDKAHGEDAWPRVERRGSLFQRPQLRLGIGRRLRLLTAGHPLGVARGKAAHESQQADK